jgi:hypothetical protein
VIVAGDGREVGAEAELGRFVIGRGARRVGWAWGGGAVHRLAVFETGDVRDRDRVEPGAGLGGHEHEGEEQTTQAARVGVRSRPHP